MEYSIISRAISRLSHFSVELAANLMREIFAVLSL